MGQINSQLSMSLEAKYHLPSLIASGVSGYCHPRSSRSSHYGTYIFC